MRTDLVWQEQALAETFLTGVRGAIPFATEQIAMALSILATAEIPIRRVVDLGCGDGAIADAILSADPEVHVTAVDFSAPMLEQAQTRLAKFGDRSQLLQADLYTPDWKTELSSFDAVLSGYCIHHLPDQRKQALYAEIYHLLNPGGWFLNIEHVASTSAWGEALFNEQMVDRLYAWQQAQGSSLSRQAVATKYVYRADKAANILAPVEQQCQWLRELGFQRVDCYFKFLEVAVFGGMRQISAAVGQVEKICN